jgi:tetratricopeptide (TPR) repeat protein
MDNVQGDKTMNKTELLNSGLKKFAIQDYRGAISDLNKAIELDPKFDLAYNALAESYNKMGDIDKAIVIAKRYIDISPKDPFAHTALSRLYVQKGMIAEAEEEMAKSNQLANS